VASIEAKAIPNTIFIEILPAQNLAFKYRLQNGSILQFMISGKVVVGVPASFPSVPLRTPISPGEILGRNQRTTPVEAQQPKATPDDGFESLGRCEHCRTTRTHR
jgi:hypothetical protein